MAEQVHGQASTAALVKFNFRGDDLDVVTAGTEAHIGIRRVCEALGIAFEPQIRKLKTDGGEGVIMMVTPSDGGAQTTACLPIRSLPLWLATIHPSKVKLEAREKLIAYRRECAEVLADHFYGKRGAVAPSTDLATIRNRADEILAAVNEHRPASVEGLAMALRPLLDHAVVEATAPLAVRLGEQAREIATLRAEATIIAMGIKAIHELAVAADRRVVDLSEYLATNSGTIGFMQLTALRREVTAIAAAWVALGWSKKSKSQRSAEAEIRKDILALVNWNQAGQTMEEMPVVAFPYVRARLKRLRAEAERALRGSKSKPRPVNQPDLFDKPN